MYIYKAKAGALTVEDMAGGTFTVRNYIYIFLSIYQSKDTDMYVYLYL